MDTIQKIQQIRNNANRLSKMSRSIRVVDTYQHLKIMSEQILKVIRLDQYKVMKVMKAMKEMDYEGDCLARVYLDVQGEFTMDPEPSIINEAYRIWVQTATDDQIMGMMYNNIMLFKIMQKRYDPDIEKMYSAINPDTYQLMSE